MTFVDKKKTKKKTFYSVAAQLKNYTQLDLMLGIVAMYGVSMEMPNIFKVRVN